MELTISVTDTNLQTHSTILLHLKEGSEGKREKMKERCTQDRTARAIRCYKSMFRIQTLDRSTQLWYRITEKTEKSSSIC